ncbi:DNA recombination and repair protein RecO [hydrothermal vent metagenome]|uniref:DNA repair protein RecO n=1 Tax=hydrothermal vent metagenome TaxID=652676 RepID=A0A3B0RSB0_9ZZZZ
MDWQADGYVLAVRRHGENSAIIEVLTREYGRYAGLVRGASGKRLRGLLQPGNLLHLNWRARLSEHLGMFTIEDAGASIAPLLDDALALCGLSSACAIISMTVPEREAHERLFDGFAILVAQLQSPQIWPALLVRLEAGILAELGYGLDLSKCAATGARDNLTHVSPRTGRAVSAKAAQPYLDKLLDLPAFLIKPAAELASDDIKHGLALTAYFLERRVLWPVDKQLPDARERMLERLLG